MNVERERRISILQDRRGIQQHRLELAERAGQHAIADQYRRLVAESDRELARMGAKPGRLWVR